MNSANIMNDAYDISALEFDCTDEFSSATNVCCAFFVMSMLL